MYDAQLSLTVLYTDGEALKELRRRAEASCLGYLQQVCGAQLSLTDLAQLELSVWVSGTSPLGPEAETSMGLAFRDRPLALLSGAFCVQAGGHPVSGRMPTVFVDLRGLPACRYTRGRSRRLRAAAAGERGEEARGGCVFAYGVAISSCVLGLRTNPLESAAAGVGPGGYLVAGLVPSGVAGIGAQGRPFLHTGLLSAVIGIEAWGPPSCRFGRHRQLPAAWSRPFCRP